MAEAVYGSPPAALVELDPGAVQLSPFVVGSTALEAVETTSMPLGNKTGMTPEERATLGRWIDAGAVTP